MSDSPKSTEQWTNHNNAVSVLAGIFGIVAALYGAIQSVNATIESKVHEATALHTELLSALFIQKAASPYSAALRYAEIYGKKAKDELPQDLRYALASALLNSIKDSGFVEDFESSVRSIEVDSTITLQRGDLNCIGVIYIMLGDFDKALPILERARNRVEHGTPISKHVQADTHWFLAIGYLLNGEIDLAVDNVLEANRLGPSDYRLAKLEFKSSNDIDMYISDSPLLERLASAKPKFEENFLRLSELLAHRRNDGSSKLSGQQTRTP